MQGVELASGREICDHDESVEGRRVCVYVVIHTTDIQHTERESVGPIR